MPSTSSKLLKAWTYEAFVKLLRKKVLKMRYDSTTQYILQTT